MIATLRDSTTRLSELVQRAIRGQEILITVRGKPTARLLQTSEPITAHRRMAEAARALDLVVKDFA
jgi:prevent-host-death family protein